MFWDRAFNWLAMVPITLMNTSLLNMFQILLLVVRYQQNSQAVLAAAGINGLNDDKLNTSQQACVICSFLRSATV